MKIILNNRNEEFKDIEKLTVSELLDLKNFTFKMLIVKINNSLIKKEDFNKTEIQDGDNVMVLHLISGG